MHPRGIALPAVLEANECCFSHEPVELDHSVQASSVRTHLLRLAPKAGSEKRVHPPGLRHTCAAELAMERILVHVIRKQLGHASLHTTTVYLEYIAPVELADTMRGRNWNL
jgi:integrase